MTQFNTSLTDPVFKSTRACLSDLQNRLQHFNTFIENATDIVGKTIAEAYVFISHQLEKPWVFPEEKRFFENVQALLSRLELPFNILYQEAKKILFTLPVRRLPLIPLPPMTFRK